MGALVVNLYGGPGTGKSTTAAGVFHLLKLAGINAELITEYAKDKVWEGSLSVLDNQLYIFGKQYHRIFRCLDKVDVIVTDSPILLAALYYEGTNPYFLKMVREEYIKMRTLDVFLNRVKPYNPAGRVQNEDKARALDDDLRDLVKHYCPHPVYMDADEHAPELIKQNVVAILRGGA